MVEASEVAFLALEVPMPTIAAFQAVGIQPMLQVWQGVCLGIFSDNR